MTDVLFVPVTGGQTRSYSHWRRPATDLGSEITLTIGESDETGDACNKHLYRHKRDRGGILLV